MGCLIKAEIKRKWQVGFRYCGGKEAHISKAVKNAWFAMEETIRGESE